MKQLRVALIGCGIIAEDHIRAYEKHADRAQITVCCDIDHEKARQRASLVGESCAVASYEAILADPRY